MCSKLNYDPELVRRVCEESGSMRAAARRLSISFNTLKKIAEEVGCYKPNQYYQIAGYRRGKHTKDSIASEFLSNKKVIGAAELRALLVREGIKEARCEGCGITEWRGRPVTLELHHKDGNKYNNHLDNLAILCPNCHSWETAGSNTSMINRGDTLVDKGYQDVTELRRLYKPPKSVELCKKLEGEGAARDGSERLCKNKINYRRPLLILRCAQCGKEFKVTAQEAKDRLYCSPDCAIKASTKFVVSSDELLAMFKTTPNYTKVAKVFGVTDNSIKKRCKKLGIYEEVARLIEEEKRERGKNVSLLSRTKEAIRKGVETRLKHLDDYVGYRLGGLQFTEVCRYKTKAELEAAGYNGALVGKACRGERKTYKKLYWRREKKVSA